MDAELYFNHSLGSVVKIIWGDLQKAARHGSLKILFPKQNFQTSGQYKSL